MGNIHSIEKALNLYSNEVEFTEDAVKLKNCHAMVLPGDGAFAAAMDNLKGEKEELLRAHVASGKPLLGVCIGFQILFENSNELPFFHTGGQGISNGTVAGLGLIPGVVRKFQFDDPHLRIPHMGWNPLVNNKGSFVPYDQKYMYFIHSYRAEEVPTKNILAECNYGGDIFPAAVQKDNIMATQFHPEKSDKDGLKLLEDWVKSI